MWITEEQLLPICAVLITPMRKSSTTGKDPSSDANCSLPLEEDVCSRNNKEVLIADRIGERGSSCNYQKNKATESFSCFNCNKVMRDKRALRSHVNRCSSEKTFLCNQCPQAFKKSAKLKRHILTHRTTRDYECDICHEFYKSPDTLRAHKKIHTKKPKERVKKKNICHICHKEFKFPNKLRDHMITHSGAKDHKCDICHKSYARFMSLHLHKLKHFGNEKQYHCEVCDAVFTDGSVFG